ncbi:hypothetical protein OSB04_030268 [Centaurea solstitialis]|uniref:Uncharacterized protein n=1 Tax=Centaurea solstitialis TaxID=347529 RepID=A0AA38SJX2_9ASTR|nr:hypothetical protein OSB04_030268 [Centaurea solstitialis]
MIDLKIEATLAARNQGAKSLQQRRDRGRSYVDIEVSSNALLKGKKKLSARTGKYVSGSNNFLEHLEDWKTTLDSSEQTKSYADRRRSGFEVPSEKACPFEGFTMEGSNLFPL